MKLYRVGSGISLSLQRLQRPGLVHSQPPRSFPGFSLYKFSGCPAPWWGSTCKPLWAGKKMANHKARRPPRSESHWVWRSWELLKNVLLENYFTELSLIFFFLSFICTMKSVPWVKSRFSFSFFFFRFDLLPGVWKYWDICSLLCFSRFVLLLLEQSWWQRPRLLPSVAQRSHLLDTNLLSHCLFTCQTPTSTDSEKKALKAAVRLDRLCAGSSINRDSKQISLSLTLPPSLHPSRITSPRYFKKHIKHIDWIAMLPA